MFHEWNPTGTQGHSLWVNPPFEMWPEVAEKVVNAQVRCLCCIPDWGSPLLDDLVPLAARRLYIPAGSSVFQYGEASVLQPNGSVVVGYTGTAEKKIPEVTMVVRSGVHTTPKSSWAAVSPAGEGWWTDKDIS